MGAIRQFGAWLKPRRRRRALGGIAILFGIGSALLGGLFRDKDGNFSVSAMPDPLAILASRSPGLRARGALYQTKPRFAGAARSHPPSAIPPHERILSTGRRRPEAAFMGPATSPFGLDGRPLGFVSMPDVSPTSVGPAFDVPGFGFGNVPVAPGTPDGEPSVPPPPVPPPPGPAVPEPSTWVLMILGFGAIGYVLRRRPGDVAPVHA